MAEESTTIRFARELDMYPPILAFFSRFDTAIAEVPFFGKRIDLLFSTASFLSLYAVEIKLHDWRSAFKQAALNQLAAQRSFIAIPSRLAVRLEARERDLFLRYDVGLIEVGERVSILIPPKKNGCFSLRHYKVLKNTIQKTQSWKPKRIGVAADAIAKRSQALVVLQTRAN